MGQRREGEGHATKTRITIKEIEITGMVLNSKPKLKIKPRKKRKTISAIAMADQPIVEDEEWYEATYAISLAGCDKGRNNRTAVNSNKDIWQSDAQANSMMEKDTCYN